EAPGGIKVAIKIIFRPLPHEEAQVQLRSFELSKSLSHPFLLLTHAYWVAEGRLYLVMELADGSLRDRLKECQRAGMAGIPVDELMTYIGEAAEGIDFLHSQQVLHRNIKPTSILLIHGHARVSDFGLAHPLEDTSESTMGSGTPAYMAP